MADPQLRGWFDAIDVDRSGRLDARELQRALGLGNLSFGLSDVVSGRRILFWALRHRDAAAGWPCPAGAAPTLQRHSAAPLPPLPPPRITWSVPLTSEGRAA